MTEIMEKGFLAKKASMVMQTLSTEQKNRALVEMAEQLRINKEKIKTENQKDLQQGKSAGLSESVLDRILLNDERIETMAEALELLAGLKDPVGEVMETIKKENGLLIEKVRVPLGVIGMIYEARPNVTIDAASLALKTGNSILLKGSSSAFHSNAALVACIHKALAHTNLPLDAVQLLHNNSREAVKELFHCNQYLDVLIPRGGKNLIQTVLREASVPVLETGAGNCHLYIDESADPQMAISIALNAKVQRPSVCNSIETVLIHKGWFEQFGQELFDAFHDANVKVFADSIIGACRNDVYNATEEDWGCEYLDKALSAKVVDHHLEAIEHINKYGTKHSECIVTENADHAALFQQLVDAAAVYHNASTRFTDGFEFGYGAEIGISTQKLHARGPMGLPALTSSKFLIKGNGQLRQ
ncbi:glutamate-5-semialdehyde dehydrogenase [Bacillus testis]|uniref:glutamate-5-semialdehyde dehydrogenase n=1 Tax=Bacillus testis TaxID=1622072 RepID=UPI00067F0571|nr:glutamate-5-semialdehyde dehydrogenase [Bacillus testis]